MMDKTVIVIPTYVSVSAVLFQQWMDIARWCGKNEIEIMTIPNRTHNDARNWLATGGGGFVKPRHLTDQIDYIIWIDSDQVFSIDDLKKIIDCDDKFCTGWYLKGDTPMVARWDEETFLQTASMNFLTKSELKKANGKLIEVDYCGFGFTKTHVSLYEELTYPFFRNKVVEIGDYMENVSEDASFCLDVSTYCGIKPKVISDLKIGHLKETVI